MIVMKFGGSSLADAERIRAAAEIVRRRQGRRPVVVVSALAGVTDLLEQGLAAAGDDDLDRLERVLADIERRHRWALSGCIEHAARRHQLALDIDRLFEELRRRLRSVRVLGEGTPKVRDAVLAVGEALSSRIVAAAFVECELPARCVESGRVIITDDRFGAATPQADVVRERCRAELAPLIDEGLLPVIGGFVGASPAGDVTTLGRGGSDTSAAVLGLALEAEEIQIWTDVDGLMSADPRLVPNARTLERVGFPEAAELAWYGARVLHPESIAPAVRRNIPVRVLNSLRPERPGTVILGETAEPAATGLVAVASKEGIGVARITSHRLPMDPALPARLLALCAEAAIELELLLVSATTMTVVTRDAERLEGLQQLSESAQVEILNSCAIVCVVGSAVGCDAVLRERVLCELTRREPELIAFGALRSSVTAVVRQDELAPCVRALHGRFFERGSEA